MDSAYSSSKVTTEDSGAAENRNTGKIGNGVPQPDSPFRPRFILSNGELTGKQLHMLRHPKSGHAAVYAIGSKAVEELLKFDDDFRSVLYGDNVVSSGSLALLVPVNPVLLLLPYLRKHAQDDCVPLERILMDDAFPAIKLLANVESVKSLLKQKISDSSLTLLIEESNFETYKYSESMLVEYLKNKLNLTARTDCHESPFDQAVRDILEENLPAEVLSLIKNDVAEEEKTDLFVHKRLNQNNTRVDEDRDGVKGNVLKPLQATDPAAETIPSKRPCITSGKRSEVGLVD